MIMAACPFVSPVLSDSGSTSGCDCCFFIMRFRCAADAGSLRHAAFMRSLQKSA